MPPRNSESYELILVGSGFASTFFLLEYLRRAAEGAKILVLERGVWNSHRWQLAHPDGMLKDALASFANRTPSKPWVYGMGVGGGSNCWWASTPRMLPEDFRLRSTYGVGRDWPLDYAELEESYARAEDVMAVSGPDDGSPFPRSGPYPQPPHRLTDPDHLLKRAYPDQFFVQPTARPRVPTARRPGCCANGVCRLCPIDSKFTILNELAHLFEDPRVTLLTEAAVQRVQTRGDVALGVDYVRRGRRHFAAADLVGLGANAIFNPHVLLRSGLDHPLLGRRLHEQVSLMAKVWLEGVDNFQGSTSLTGHGYMLYAGARRRERPAVLLETSNIPHLRLERGRYRQILELKAIFEDLPQERNAVSYEPAMPARPALTYHGYSDYTARGLASLAGDLEQVLAPLPVERLEVDASVGPTEYHILGTTVMGADPQQSVVDAHCIHHRIRNLLVLGGSTFPTGAPANPTLTICALSLFAADRLRRSQA